MKTPLALGCVCSLLWLASPARATASPADFKGLWELNRAESESMRPLLAAQGYTGFEIGILERVSVAQQIEPSGVGRLQIRTKTSVVASTEDLLLDDVARPADSPLGRVERAAAWDEPAQTLRTRIKYQARNGQAAEMWITRRRLDAGRFAQETRLRLADGREFRARQIFVRR